MWLKIVAGQGIKVFCNFLSNKGGSCDGNDIEVEIYIKQSLFYTLKNCIGCLHRVHKSIGFDLCAIRFSVPSPTRTVPELPEAVQSFFPHDSVGATRLVGHTVASGRWHASEITKSRGYYKLDKCFRRESKTYCLLIFGLGGK